MKRMLLCAALAAAAAVAVSGAAAAKTKTNECKGFKVCVPIAGPWVLAQGRIETNWQLACPKNFVIGGLDAELTNPELDLAFRAILGSPVSAGISTSSSAVFLGRLVSGRDPAASFRPHIGCLPTQKSGAPRIPTVHHKFYSPHHPAVLRTSFLPVRAGATGRFTRSCLRREHLVSSTVAIGFYTKQPPSRALAQAVRITRRTSGGNVTVTTTGGEQVQGARALVQLDLLCAGRK
jgi:hypothetical protein